MKRCLKAWVLKRRYLDEHTGEVGGTLLYFYDNPPDYGNLYEWIRMSHLDQEPRSMALGPGLLDSQRSSDEINEL